MLPKRPPRLSWSTDKWSKICKILVSEITSENLLPWKYLWGDGGCVERERDRILILAFHRKGSVNVARIRAEIGPRSTETDSLQVKDCQKPIKVSPLHRHHRHHCKLYMGPNCSITHIRPKERRLCAGRDDGGISIYRVQWMYCNVCMLSSAFKLYFRM